MMINWKKFRWYGLAVLVLANILIWSAVRSATPSGILSVHFLDVGQGDSALIISPTGNEILIDGGPSQQILRELAGYKSYFDRHLDLVIESHPDSDHIGGLPDVFGLYQVSGFLEPGSATKSSDWRFLRKILGEQKMPDIFATAGQRIDIGGGAYFNVLFPKAGQTMESNASSVILKLVYGDKSFLFTGDTTLAVENALAGMGADIHADVYKVAHHGSKNSNSENFIKIMSPKIAVISVGKDNRYGHPNQIVLDYLTEVKAQIFRTDQVGDINIETDGKTLIVKK